MIGFGQQTYVPDDNFEFTLVNLGYDSILDDSVLTANINTVTNLSITNQNISDLTGIEDFVNLEELLLMGNNLSSLDISNNLFLNTLGCSLNQLTSIDVTNNILLTNLYLEGNQLGLIDISNNTNLESLNLANNLFSNIDINNNLLLNSLGVGGNQLTNLDISNHILLSGFSCENNQFTSLDVSQNIALTSLYCHDNQITSIDLSGASNLTALYCYNNQLLNLDLRNGNNTNLQIDSQNNPNLFCIDVDNIALSNVLWGANIDSWSSFSTNCVTALGCTDLIACNYDTLATIDDGSCVYLNTSVFISNVSCNGYSDGGIVATATGGATPNYQYSLGGGLSQNNGTFSNLTAGTYFIDVTDINGCSSNQTVIITEPNPLFVNAFSTDISCFGYCDGSAFCMPSGGTSPYSYLWSGGNTFVTDNISGLCAGAYVVNITDANNCINIETVLISEPLPLVSNNTINGCDSVLIGSNYYTISGAYTDTLTSVNGCDSVVNTNLTIEQNTSSYDTLSVGASIVWNGIPLNASGDYSVILINSVGCDSIVNLNLTVTTTGISDIVNNKSNLIKITDMLGQETPYRRNTPLFYIYDDGTVEKRIILE